VFANSLLACVILVVWQVSKVREVLEAAKKPAGEAPPVSYPRYTYTHHTMALSQATRPAKRLIAVPFGVL
jgi:uncharacterized membrane protein